MTFLIAGCCELMAVGCLVLQHCRKCCIWSVALFGAENWTFR